MCDSEFPVFSAYWVSGCDEMIFLHDDDDDKNEQRKKKVVKPFT